MAKPKIKILALSRSKGFTKYYPTKEEIKDWLRTEHKIHISVSVYADESIEEGKEFYETNIVDVNADWNTFAVGSFYDDYDVAMDELLESALNLID